jgi:hypothetical protein
MHELDFRGRLTVAILNRDSLHCKDSCRVELDLRAATPGAKTGRGSNGTRTFVTRMEAIVKHRYHCIAKTWQHWRTAAVIAEFPREFKSVRFLGIRQR